MVYGNLCYLIWKIKTYFPPPHLVFTEFIDKLFFKKKKILSMKTKSNKTNQASKQTNKHTSFYENCSRVFFLFFKSCGSSLIFFLQLCNMQWNFVLKYFRSRLHVRVPIIIKLRKQILKKNKCLLKSC